MNEILYNALRKYSLNQLSPEEKASLEQQIENDPALAAAAADYLAILEGIDQTGDQILDARLTAQAEELLKTEKKLTLHTSNVPKLTAKRRFLYAAAAVFLLLAVALPFLLDKSSQTTDEIFAANFTVPPLNVNRSGSPSAWEQAYQDKNYGKVIFELSALPAHSPSKDSLSQEYFCLGISYLASSPPNPPAALAAFEQVSRNSHDWPSSRLYSAMAFVKIGEKDEARKTLLEIVGHPKARSLQTRAKDFLEDLGE